MINSWYDVSVERAPKQKVLVDPFAADAPLFREMPVEAASAQMKNVYEKIKEIEIPQVVDLDAPLPIANMKSEIGESSLFKIGASIVMPVDKIRLMGGKEAFLAKRLPKILRETGKALDREIFENHLKAAAINAGKFTKVNASATGNTTSTIVAVKWVPGETTGLYDPSTMGAGKVFETTWMWDGSVGKLPSGETGWLLDIAGYFGVQVANPNYVAALVNIDANNLPSADQLLQLITDVQGYPSDTRLYAPRNLVMKLVSKFAAKNGSDYSDVIRYENGTLIVDGVPFIGDYNFKYNTETAVPV